ncbi:hypothetical protein JI362_005188, partial [Escherichia coli]|nr:hypothetical protein [Escherichia coli]
DNKDTIQRITRLNAFICKNINSLDEVKNVSDENLRYVIRTIQDEIFLHRCSGTPVPDLIHMLLKKRNEYINKKQLDYFFQKNVKLKKGPHGPFTSSIEELSIG